MATSFFFYDLETTGFNPREARIMQFAGQRTDMELNAVGEPVDVLIKITPDILPDPSAILVTSITPQMTLTDGITEAEFLKQFTAEVAIPGTIFVGYNTIRFDDEFMRFILFRNFYDPYQWQWKDERSRWDLLDVVRMTRALRPNGIKWPFNTEGKASNSLELLTSINKIAHANAHDALSDVNATIGLAKLIRQKQPKLFDYLLKLRDKRLIAELVGSGKPIVYTSGKYSSEFEKTTVVQPFFKPADKQSMLVYDLRFDPSEFSELSPAELVERWRYTRDENAPPRLPIKTLKYNRCPAVAPLAVLDEASIDRLKLDMNIINENCAKLKKLERFQVNISEALQILDKDRQTSFEMEETAPESKLYDGFISDTDNVTAGQIHQAQPEEIMGFLEKLKDVRLKQILPLYKARNFPRSLDSDERTKWDEYCISKLVNGGKNSRLAKYFGELETLSKSENLSDEHKFLLEELKYYGESLVPSDNL